MTAAVLVITGAALLVLQGATFLVALRAGKHSVVDTAWGIGIALAALAAFLVSLGHGDPARRALLLGASALWGLRLAAYVGRRNHGKPEDPRYADVLRGKTNLYALRMVYLLQAAILWLATVPVQLGMLERSPGGPLAVIGTVLFVVGFAFESVGDWQLARFKASAGRARSWTAGCGATPGTRTTSATSACGGGCSASAWAPGVSSRPWSARC